MEDTMIGYIEESGKIVRNNVKNSEELTRTAVDVFCSHNFKRILIVASGSSYNGSYGSKLFMEKLLKVKVDIVTSFTFKYYETIFDKDTMVFGIGQSGRSTNTNEALQKAKDLGLTTVGLTGNVDSVMKDHCDYICNWGMGIEKIGFVTKGVAALTAYLDLFAIESAKKLYLIAEKDYKKYKEELYYTGKIMDETVEIAKKWYHENEEELTDLKRVQITGYGTSFASALEGALKIAETTGHAATGYEMEEFLHGPSIETDENHTVMIIDSDGEPKNRANLIFNGVHLLTHRVFLLTSTPSEDRRVLVHKEVPEYYSSLINNIPFQVISAYGRDKWVNPLDEPRKKMNEMIGYKAPKTGKELGL